MGNNIQTLDDAAEVFAQSREARTAVIQYACKESLGAFVKAFWPVLEPSTEMKAGWALDAMVEHLEAVEKGYIKRLLISVPPGSMKSLLTRAFFPAWIWARHPATRIIGVAYAEKLAVRDNIKARRIIQSPLYQRLFPNVELAPDEFGKITFANTKTGRIIATSVGGTLTGERGDLILLDDVLSADQAQSDVERDSANTWFRETLPSRVNDIEKSAIVCIGQRLHEDDPYAQAIAQGYEHLLIPAEYEASRAKMTCIGWQDPRETENELYWADRYPKVELAKMEKILGPYAYSAQFQQNPTPREGGLLKTAKITMVDNIPDEDIQWAVGFDFAASVATTADFTARVRIGFIRRTNKFIISHADRKRVDPGDGMDWVSSTAQMLKQEMKDGAQVMLVLPVEPAAAGKYLQDQHVKNTMGCPVQFEKMTNAKNKETRAQPLAVQIDNGDVMMLNGPWNDKLLNEMAQFPLGANDDQVDALTTAFNSLNYGPEEDDLNIGWGGKTAF